MPVMSLVRHIVPLMVLALVAKQNPEKRIFVMDCDQHGGDGTAIFTNRLTNLVNFGILGFVLVVKLVNVV